MSVPSGCIEYSAHVKTMTAISAGLNITTYTQEQRNAGNGPQNLCCFENVSNKYAYSAPDLGTTVPNSAKHNAPAKNYYFNYFRL